VAAALRPPEEAHAAWAAWNRRVALDDVDPTSFALLPLVHANLTAAGVDRATLARLRNVHRHAWLERQVAFEGVAALRSVLDRAGVPVLGIGGTSRIRYYGESPARPLSDAGLLVRPEDAGAAVDAVRSYGWEHVGLPVDLGRRRSATFRGERDARVAVHWRVLGRLHDSDDDGPFWDRSRDGALSPEDELVHVLVHGVAGTDPVPWPADAAMVVRGGVDWGTFLGAVRAARVDLAVRRGLALVADRGGVAVPDHVRSALRVARGDAVRLWSRRRGARTPAELIRRKLSRA
jgi:hypothetical protein